MDTFLQNWKEIGYFILSFILKVSSVTYPEFLHTAPYPVFPVPKEKLQKLI